jgi:nucleoside-diphosphate-sugar epimerase
MRILFIGGTGNISADCAALLHQRGHQITVLTRGRSEVPPQFRKVLADRKDPASMRQALQGPPHDVVLNFLGYELPEVQADWELFQDSIRQYIFISSATVYAKPPAKLPVTETAPLGNAWWEYAQKKLACEEWLLQKNQESRFPLTIVRPSHTYSKLWVPNPVSSSSFTFALRLQEGKPVFVPDMGENPWTLTAASDFAGGLAGLVGNPKAIGEAFHITSDEVLTWNQIVDEIAQAMGAASPNVVKIPTDFICRIAPQMTGSLKGDKAHPGIFDNSKIKRFVPEFECRKTFRIGVRESIDWLRLHPEHQNLSPKIDSLCDEMVAAWQRTGQPR